MSRFTRLLSGRKAQHKAHERRTIRPRVEALEERALLANIQWTGLGANNLWFTEDNWIDRDTAAVQRPVNGDNLFFPSDAARRTNSNNSPVVLQINSLSFTTDGPLSGLGYAISGDQIQLGAGGMTHSVNRTDTISTDILLPLTRVFNVTAGNLALGGTLSGTAGVTKNGTGTLTFTQATANTYTLTTTVNAGVLVLSKNAGVVAVPGFLRIGDGFGGADTDVVRLLTNDQIANGALVTVNGSGRLDLNNRDETSTGLNMTDGSVTIGATGVLTLLGDVFTSQSAAAATISGGRLFMAEASPTFIVANGTAADDLIVSATVSSFFQRALAKTGAGRLVLSGANDFSGTMTVGTGILNMRSTTALGQAGSGTAVAFGAALEVELGEATVNEPLTLSGTGIDGTGALVHVNLLAFPDPATLEWMGPITLNSTAGIGSIRPYFINNPLRLRGAIGGVAGAGLTKLGPGLLHLLHLTGNNTYSGPTTVAAGILAISGAQPNSPVTVNDGSELRGGGTIGALTANSGGTVRPTSSPP